MLLSSRGAEDDIAGADGTTALIWAAHRNDAQMVDLLLRAGADVKAANDYGATALYAAAANADPAITVRLLAAGADANAHLSSGETPLMEAARHGQSRNGARVAGARRGSQRTGSNGGQTALMWAISERHAAVTEELVRAWRRRSRPFQKGIHRVDVRRAGGDAGSARILLGGGANPNDVMPKTDLTPLIIAAATGRTEVVALLLDKDANPKAVAADGFTSLHYAAANKEGVEMLRALLAHGAKPNVRLNQEKPTVAAVRRRAARRHAAGPGRGNKQPRRGQGVARWRR